MYTAHNIILYAHVIIIIIIILLYMYIIAQVASRYSIYHQLEPRLYKYNNINTIIVYYVPILYIIYTRDDDVKESPHVLGHYYNNIIPIYIILYCTNIWEMCRTGKGATAKDRAAMAEEYNAHAVIESVARVYRYTITIPLILRPIHIIYLHEYMIYLSISIILYTMYYIICIYYYVRHVVGLG